jgi:hypothetical protein
LIIVKSIYICKARKGHVNQPVLLRKAEAKQTSREKRRRKGKCPFHPKMPRVPKRKKDPIPFPYSQ